MAQLAKQSGGGIDQDKSRGNSGSLANVRPPQEQYQRAEKNSPADPDESGEQADGRTDNQRD